MSNITNCDSGSFSTENTGEDAVKQQSEILGQFHSPNSHASTTTNNSNGSNTNSQLPPPVKKKRSLPGNPDPSAEVIALSPNSLVATNRFICEICDKGFRRDQNLQLHRRGHNLPWKLKQRASTEVRKRVYVCPEATCVHHNPTRALGDLTGIKKHFSRKHGEKKWKCDKCSKKYAVQCDWKAHSKICGTKEYKCDCGTIFSRRDSFITHRAFCDALAEENKKVNEEDLSNMGNSNMQGQPIPNQVASSLPIINTNLNPQMATSEFNNNSDRKHPLSSLPQTLMTSMPATTRPFNNMAGAVFTRSLSSNSSLPLQLSSNMSEENGLHLAASGLPHMSATALLQKAAQLGATVSDNNNNNTNGMITGKSFVTSMAPPSFGETQQQLYGIMNQYMHNGQHDFSSQYNFNANGMDGGSVGMSGLDMFNAILDQSKALSKIIEQNSRSSNSVFRSSSAFNVDGTKGSEDVMTLDLLGIGGGGGGGGGAHGDLYGGAQPSETDARDEIWRNWSNNNSGFESFSAT